MVETDKTLVIQDIRTEAQREFDELSRDYSQIKEPAMEKDNPNALFANGWGRRGHFALLVAPSGVGKSVITTQDVVPWAAGKQGLVGSAPLFPLRVAIIQAEDDDTEMGEFRRDHRKGYLAEGWTIEEVLDAERKVRDWSPYFRGKTGDAFITGLDIALERQPVDAIIMNPLQSYTGFDISKNDQLSAFLRTSIDRMLVKHRVFMLCVHHTNKPATGAAQGKGGPWGDDATAAYLGAGGAELTNYARSVTIIRRCAPKECKIENSFVLLGAKRGNRLGWKDADGNKSNKKIIAYSEEYIHWRVPSAEEIEEAGGASAKPVSRPAPLTDEEAAERIAAVIRADWPKKRIAGYCRDKLCADMTRAEFTAGWKHLEAHLDDFGFHKVNDGNKAYHFEAILDAKPQDLDGMYDNDSQPFSKS